MIDLKKTYRSRDGRSVTLHEIVGGNVYGRLGLHAMRWNFDGSYVGTAGHPLDLVEVKTEIRNAMWVNVYMDKHFSYVSRQLADSFAAPGRLACVYREIICHEGDGLEDGK